MGQADRNDASVPAPGEDREAIGRSPGAEIRVARLDGNAEVVIIVVPKTGENGKTCKGNGCAPPAPDVLASGEHAGRDAAELPWRHVQRRLVRLLHQGEPYTSMKELADRLGCSKTTVWKAVNDNSPEGTRLRSWMARAKGEARAENAPLRVTSLTGPILASVPQTRERDPSDHLSDEDVAKVIARIMDRVGPEAQQRLKEQTPDEHRLLARVYLEQQQDPDSAPLDLSGKPKPTKLWGRKA